MGLVVSPKWVKQQRVAIIGLIAYDLLSVMLAHLLILAWSAGGWLAGFQATFTKSLPVTLLIVLLVYYGLGIYHTPTAYTGWGMCWFLPLVNGLAISISALGVYLIDGQHRPSYQVLGICLLATILMAALRLLVPFIGRNLAAMHGVAFPQPWQDGKMRAVIVGNEQGVLEVIHLLRKEAVQRYHIVGILNLGRHQTRRKIGRIRVLGGWEIVRYLVDHGAIDEVLVASHAGSGQTLRESIETELQQRIPIRMVSVSAGAVQGSPDQAIGDIDTIQPVAVLQREARNYVQPNEYALRGKRVLVTGAGGSLGRELCRQICRQNPALLVLLGHGEQSILAIHQELMKDFPDVAGGLVMAICDIREGERFRQLVRHYRVQAIFHAAGHTHPGLMECNLAETVRNNLVGTRHVLTAGSISTVRSIVLPTSMQGVRPTSVPGVLSFLCEEMALAESARVDACLLVVRCGRLLDSRYGLLTCIRQAIMATGTVTLPHAEARVYVTTAAEVASAMLHAVNTVANGSIVMPDMGMPVRLLSLAEDVIRLCGMTPYHGVPIVFSATGTAPAVEEVMTDGERAIMERRDGLYIIKRPPGLAPAMLDALLHNLTAAATSMHDDQVRRQLKGIIPAFDDAGEVTPTASQLHAA